MVENEQLKQQQGQSSAAQEQAKGSTIKGTGALCKYCGAALEPNFPFCTTCGEKIAGDEIQCEFCKTKTSKEFCPHCGRRVVPLTCSNCGAKSIYDACENCGAILNSALKALLSQEITEEPAQMSAQEAAQIESEFKAMDESAEFKAFQKKLIERQILLEERDYFNKREKRIIKVFGSQPFTMELPDPEEEAYRMKIYEALEKAVIKREEKAIEDELNRLFPPSASIDTDTTAEDARLAEIEKNRAEIERKFNDALVNVNSEVENFHIEEERKRLEEERRRLEEERRRIEEERRRKEEEARREAERQRQIEIERRRLEEERQQRRFQGIYYHSSHNGMLTASLRIDGNRAVCQYRCSVCGSATVNYRVSINGDGISLVGGQKYGDYCSFREYNLVENYNGYTNDSGTVLTGQWYKYSEGVPVVFYKR